MSYQPFVVEKFGSLDLVTDPEEIGLNGAVDLLNIDFARDGELGSRAGYATWNGTAGANYYTSVYGFRTSPTVAQVAAGSGSNIDFFDAAGALITSAAVVSATGRWSFAPFGTPANTYLYLATEVGGLGTVRRWDGATFTTPAGMPLGTFVTVQAADNRLVVGGGAGAALLQHRVSFSDAGAPETHGANNYVEITPGDGESLSGLCSWRDLVFAFKETKFAVFYGNSVSGTGDPVFNYRMVRNTAGPLTNSQVAVGEDGVYFLGQRGIYRTTGDTPQLISGSVNSLFYGQVSNLFAGGQMAAGARTASRLHYHNGRLYFAYATSGTTNNRVLVHDPRAGWWSLYDLPAQSLGSLIDNTSALTAPDAGLLFGYSSGTKNVGRMGAASVTTDNGTAITARFQSGFYEVGQPGADSYTRYTRMWGSGAPTLSVFTDYGSTDTNAAAVTLGTDPAVDEGYHLKAYKGRLFSHKLSATSAFNVNRIAHDVAWVRP